MQTTMFSAGITGGYKFKLLTLENSASFWQENISSSYTSSRQMHHITTNPKIGFNYKSIWLKAGPSLILYKNYNAYEMPESFRLRNVGYNVQLSFDLLRTGIMGNLF